MQQEMPWQNTAAAGAIFDYLGFKFSNHDLLHQSLTHTSYAHENGNSSLSNERLEFLGDSVLSLLISEHLTTRFPKKNEGELSKLRSALVNEDTLFDLANFLKLGDFLFLGNGEEKSGGRKKKRNLARAFEALLGGIYLDSDYQQTREVFFHFIDNYEKENGALISDKILEDFDPKTKLQEEVLKRFKNPPRYESRDLEGQSFEVSLWIEENLVESKSGSSKKKIEKELAVNALKNKSYLPLRGNNDAS